MAQYVAITEYKKILDHGFLRAHFKLKNIVFIKAHDFRHFAGSIEHHRKIDHMTGDGEFDAIFFHLLSPARSIFGTAALVLRPYSDFYIQG